MQNKLIRDLQRVAAKKLHNTRGVPKNMKDKVELIGLAFGHAEVVEDFEKWCDEHAVQPTQYPVTEYLRMIDTRLGAEQKVEVTDPNIADLQALTYELTSVLPHARAIHELLGLHSVEDIKGALKEYVLGFNEREIKIGDIRAFFDDNGAGAIITARKRRGL